MQLTAEMIAGFVGGDMEIQNPEENYLYRGPIESVTVICKKLKVRFKWLAKNDGGPRRPVPTWTSEEDRLNYEASLVIYTASDIGQGRICLNSPVTSERAVLFPPGGSKLDPSRVSGLEANG